MVSIISEGWAPPHTPNVWTTTTTNFPEVSRVEFDALKRELESLKVLLTAARKYDAETGQKDCQKDEKVALLRKLAAFVGVELPL
jgi:hypothetical protein